MHKLFVSEGLVLGKRGVGEANTLLAILTRDMGLVKAVARSARRENSKLRYGLEPLTLATYSFIRGKHEWKLVGAERASKELQDPALPLPARQAMGRSIRLLLRLIHGEEHSEALYTTVMEGFKALASSARQTPQEMQHVETVLVLRILSHLGYLPQTPELKPFIEADFFAIELAAEVAASKALLTKAINESLNATGL
ncbi:MAG TPA: recombination protein O N-terminal domain-containing protein [Candidatus Paceibacterota bacterium]|nr:recombination protein O N-terminal domain-containing protein [Candidatus Paceibacterota bacterium]